MENAPHCSKFITPTKFLISAPFAWTEAEVLQFPLGILLPLKYKPPKALLSSLLPGPSPVTQRAMRGVPLVAAT